MSSTLSCLCISFPSDLVSDPHMAVGPCKWIQRKEVGLKGLVLPGILEFPKRARLNINLGRCEIRKPLQHPFSFVGFPLCAPCSASMTVLGQLWARVTGDKASWFG